MPDNLAVIRKRSKIQLQLIPIDAKENEFTIIIVPTHITPNDIKLRNNNYDFSEGFLLFITDKNVTERDIKSDENKITISKWYRL